MSFSVVLQSMSSPTNALDKTVSALATFNNCILKSSCSILDPVIVIRTSDSNEVKAFKSCNYMYISEFGRYYFVNDVVSVRDNLFEVHGHVDVLKTYASEIRSNTAIIGRTALTSVGDYMLEDNVIKVRSDPHEATILFSNSKAGGDDSLILVAAGTQVQTS